MPEGLRQRKKDRTRLDLMRAAVALFNERGYENTTVEDIVDRADYSRSTFFRYFGSKADVVLGKPEKRLAHLLEFFQGHSDGSEDPMQLVRTVLIRHTIEITAHAPELEAECLRLRISEPSLQPLYASTVLEAEQVVADFLATQRLGPEAKPDLESSIMASAMVGVVRAAILTAQSNLDSSRIAAALERGFDLLEQGWNKSVRARVDGDHLTASTAPSV